MPQYRVTAPDGKTIVISGPEGASDEEVMRQAQALYKPQAEPAPYQGGRAETGAEVRPPSVGGDVARSAGSGVMRAAGMAGAGNPITDPWGTLSKVTGAMGLEGPSNALYAISNEGVAGRLGGDYQPQTTAGRYAKTVGEFAPNALLPSPGGKASVLQRGANVLLPALASEGAADATRALGGGEGAQTVARVAGALTGGLAAGARSGPRPPSAPRGPVPTVDDMRTAKTAAYGAVDQLGAAYTPQAVSGLVDDIAADLRSVNLSTTRHKNAASMLADLRKMKDKPLTLTEVDQLRQVIRRDVAGSEAEQFMAGRMIAKIDEFIESADAAKMTAGNADEANQAITQARSANTQYRKVRAVDEAVTKATNRASTSGTGGNVENAVRQNLRGVLEKTRNLTPAERDALTKIVRGTRGQNIMRQVGRLSPAGNGLNQALHLAALVPSGGMSAVAGVGGAIAKNVADAGTMRKVDDLVRLMASGGQRGIAAEAELAALAGQSPQIAQVYDEVSKYLLRLGPPAAMAAATSQGQE